MPNKEQNLTNEDDFYYRYNQELIKKEKTVKQAQLALLKLASLENQEEEQKPDWSNQILFPKHKVNFLKQLGNYMEDCSVNTTNFFIDESNEMKSVSKSKSNNIKQTRGASLDAKIIDKNKNSSSPQRLNIYDKKIYAGILKADLQNLDKDIFQKRSQRQPRSFSKNYIIEDLSQQQQQQQEQQSYSIDPTKQIQQKHQESQCLVIHPASSQNTNREQTALKHLKETQNTFQIIQQKEFNSSSPFRLYPSSKHISQAVIKNNQKQSSYSILEHESQDDDLGENNANQDQSSDSTRFTPLSLDRKKSKQYHQNLKRYFHEKERDQSFLQNNSSSNSMTFCNSNGKNFENIIKMKPFVISMLHNSTMISNNRDLNCGLENINQKDGESQYHHDSEKQQFYNAQQHYLKTNQSDRSTSNHITNKSISNFNSIEDEDEYKYFTQKRKVVFSSEKKQIQDRPKTSSIHNKYQSEQEINQQNKEKILDIINNTNQQSLISNSFGGIIINHPNFKNLNYQNQHKEHSKENNNDSDLFINKGALQNKNKFNMITNKQKNQKRQQQQQLICNTTRQIQQPFQKSSNYERNSSLYQNQAATERTGIKVHPKSSRAVTIEKARNSIINKNNQNISLNSSFNGINNYLNSNKSNDIFKQSFHQNQQIVFNQFAQRNNFIGQIEYQQQYDKLNKKNNIFK
ncbi:hypothetical protein TTHERM_00254490 (macronuclear) [Tetrahymena thermophila SB210]|uniref:Uncharacterized protein n=1 Tax=Tetrahymena thermophila (strain SB210) TaxID=312017 RepID=Q23QN1_TETTS|nr:hypothetical protein TTHERM_00254490 [Tetrahymena thermophila SB210]EAR98857.2 hypothetical protein TTHERM_00254490 [Tetrahymena thermophila SB210]|eukprot:XP_001019102.2 hypothetical protein TTHERM_00254490 [Tetrahymena thermophila SB210]